MANEGRPQEEAEVEGQIAKATTAALEAKLQRLHRMKLQPVCLLNPANRDRLDRLVGMICRELEERRKPEYLPGTAQVAYLADALTGGVTRDFVDEAGGLLGFAFMCAESGCSCEISKADGLVDRCLRCQALDLLAAVGAWVPPDSWVIGSCEPWTYYESSDWHPGKRFNEQPTATRDDALALVRVHGETSCGGAVITAPDGTDEHFPWWHISETQ